MRMKKSSSFLLLLLIFTGIKSQSKSPECFMKGRSMTYLDAAVELIKNAKDSYPTCEMVSVQPADCEEVMNLGQNASKVYTIWPKSRVLGGRPLDVYCDMDTDGGGWTILQRRGNFLRPKDYFFQDWKSYKSGFGDIEKDFWLGNDNIFALSNQKLYSARFDLTDVEGNKRYALYDTFWIDDEARKYALHISGYSGNAGDSMKAHDKQKFSTKDQKNDLHETGCAQIFKGGWWYANCHSANLNGLYLRGKHESYADGVDWGEWKGHNESMDTTEIKLRSKDFRKSSNIDFTTPQ